MDKTVQVGYEVVGEWHVNLSIPEEVRNSIKEYMRGLSSSPTLDIYVRQNMLDCFAEHLLTGSTADITPNPFVSIPSYRTGNLVRRERELEASFLEQKKIIEEFTPANKLALEVMNSRIIVSHEPWFYGPSKNLQYEIELTINCRDFSCFINPYKFKFAKPTRAVPHPK